MGTSREKRRAWVGRVDWGAAPVMGSDGQGRGKGSGFDRKKKKKKRTLVCAWGNAMRKGLGGGESKRKGASRRRIEGVCV